MKRIRPSIRFTNFVNLYNSHIAFITQVSSIMFDFIESKGLYLEYDAYYQDRFDTSYYLKYLEELVKNLESWQSHGELLSEEQLLNLESAKYILDKVKTAKPADNKNIAKSNVISLLIKGK